ncbi:hypothetical protein PHAMO_210236 [Magnetospirillum molischianum DSM 120]|uniref:Uncharacterized protein n=1 Tax=Magnetospirillum molischianum DSM 120 TaxID=1150626 RepID=H8FQT7_MAGML|nr:hypothetical protein PHAMO_210236 [Magnetospirillum molischianum DSM 120]
MGPGTRFPLKPTLGELDGMAYVVHFARSRRCVRAGIGRARAIDAVVDNADAPLGSCGGE